MSQTKEGTHDYYYFLMADLFLYADSWSIWNCNLNVLIFLVIQALIDIVSSTYISIYAISRTLSHMGGYTCCYMPKCVRHWGNKKMYSWDDIAWFIIFLILYVYFVSWWGWLAGVFIKRMTLQCYEISIMLTYLTFFLSLCCRICTFPWGVYIFTVLLRLVLRAFSLDAASLEACCWKI